ncbi:MAG: hypothetical protein IJQ44_05470 [Bacteroidaceae bacterium]|nr:hypothetical protein [Bacteroidaceae bacterium]
MAVIGIIILLIFGFIVFGLLGWGLKVIGWVFDFLWEGCTTSFGCLFWFAIILLLIVAMAV